jgi:hypothetical protein
MRMLSVSGLIAGVVLICSTASAQYRKDDPYYRDRRPDYRNDGYGTNANGPDLIRMVQGHLQRAASEGLRGRDRNRCEDALRQLYDFDRDLSRGKFNRRALDKAIDRVNDVVRNAPLNYRVREVLASDVNRLRDFRANGGNYAGRPYDGFGYRR